MTEQVENCKISLNFLLPLFIDFFNNIVNELTLNSAFGFCSEIFQVFTPNSFRNFFVGELSYKKMIFVPELFATKLPGG